MSLKKFLYPSLGTYERVRFLHLSDEFLQELRFRNDIVDIVSNYVSLKRSGSNMVGLCPFHREDTPSLMIYPESGSFYCFGCATGGDVITFIKKIENLDYLDAIKFLAQRSGLTMPDIKDDDDSLKQKRRILEANREAAKFFYSNLYSEEGKRALNYLKDRGLSDRTIRHFGLGYSSAERFSLTNHLKNKHFSDVEIISANLAFESRNGHAVDRFVGRVMFPIIDIRGNVVAFGGRTLSSDVKPKYLNTSDTKVFKKSMNLFALNFAKKNPSDRLILAEGYMDVIALHQAGFTEAVATLGTAITENQARIMKSYAKEVIVAYDADEAGRKATSRAIQILRDVGVSIKVLTIPRGKDPDEYIRSFKDQGSVRFNQLIKSSGNDIEYKLNEVKKSVNIQTTDGKIFYTKQSVKILAQISDDIERDVYISKISSEVDIDKLAIKSQVEKERKRSNKKSFKKQFDKIRENVSALRDTVNPQKKNNLRAANAEEALIAYIMKNQDQAKDIFMKLPEEMFCTDFNRKVYSHIKDVMEKKSSVCTSDFGRCFSDDEVSRIVKILVSDLSKVRGENVYQDYIDVILAEHEKMNIDEVISKEENLRKYMERLKMQKK